MSDNQRNLHQGHAEQHKTQHIEQIPQGSRAAWMACDDCSTRCVGGGWHVSSLQWVVDPLADADKQNANAQQQSVRIGNPLDINRQAGDCPRCTKCNKHVIPVLDLEPGVQFIPHNNASIVALPIVAQGAAQTKATVIFSAPQGWGKTRSKKQLQQEFGCYHVVDDWAPGHCTVLGALHLTNTPPGEIDPGYLLTAELVSRGWEGGVTTIPQQAPAQSLGNVPTLQLGESTTNNGRHIHLCCFLEAQRHSEVLLRQWHKLTGKTSQSAALKRATWEGYWALKTEAERCADKLTKRGQLLFAFPGTTALQGGAPC